MAREQNETTTCGAILTGNVGSDRTCFGLVQLHAPDEPPSPVVFHLHKTVRIGRGSGAELAVSDGAVSRAHAELSIRRNTLYVSDLDSRFGTFVDGNRVGRECVEARVGSVLRIGQTLLLVVENAERYATSPQRLAASFIGLSHDVWAGPEVWSAWQAAAAAAPLNHPVLIVGESGTGKEIVARLVHLSRPSPSTFTAVNLAAIPEGLFEAELFGHSRGAFTGATQARLGAFREAGNGTLFLDEVGELRPELQVKLLRVLETKTVRPLGSDSDLTVAARVVTATSRNLETLVQEGTFRPDLYYRLSAIVIRLPPLRERKADILMIARELLKREDAPLSLSTLAAERLLLQPWHGNLRELGHVIVRAVLAARTAGVTQICPEHLPSDSVNSIAPPAEPKISLSVDGLREALKQANGNATRAATLLGVSRATLYNFCTKHQVALTSLRDSV